MLELTGFSHMSDFFQQNQIYTSKWYDNYNIVLHCSMYSGFIFSLRSSNFFLPFMHLPLSGLWSSQGLCLSWLFSSLRALSVLVWVPCLAFWIYCPLVLAPWSWSFSSGPLVPLAQASCSTAWWMASLYYVICEWILPLWWTFSDHHWFASCQLVVRVVHWP